MATQRNFARHTKGGWGKENTLGANFSFPKHQELFADDYYKRQEELDFEDVVSSPLNQRMVRENHRHEDDSINWDGKTKGLSIEGGIL